MKLSKGRKIAWCICFPLIAILIVGVIVGNCVMYNFEDTITSYLCPPIIDEQAAAAARASGEELSKQIAQEGCVLVKNDGKTLPLDATENSRVNVFGWSSINWVFGGSGSGQVFDESSDKLENTADLVQALTEYGIETNSELTEFYKKYHSRIGDKKSIYVFQEAFYRLCEPSISEYTGGVLDKAKSFSDTALVVLGRRAGETEDPTRVQYKEGKATDESRTYLEISKEEEEMLEYVGANFANVVVIVNSTNVIKLDFLETIPGLDACLVVGATGLKGALGLPAVLYGEYTDEDGIDMKISPSGRFADTYAYDFESNINYHYTGDAGVGHYTGEGVGDLYPAGIKRNAGEELTTATYVDYVEGIYVGYKWYETADAMGVWDGYTRKVLGESGRLDKILTGYESVVQYPFGFGLSYTNFEWEITSFKIDGEEAKDGAAFTLDSEIAVTVKVTNAGDYVGKDVVEVYLTAPYTSGGIEKAHVSLVGFAKTANLAANGGEQEVTIKLDPYEFMSYDCYDKNKNEFKGYELEHGEYLLKLMTDSHNVKTVTRGGAKADGILKINNAEDVCADIDRKTKNKVFNKFTGEDAKESVPIDGSQASVPVEYITRENFPDPYEFAAPSGNRAMTEAEKDYNLYSAAKAGEWDTANTDLWGNPVNDETVVWGSGGGKKIYADAKVTELGMKLGADYNAPEWKEVLNQVTISEAIALAENGAFNNSAVSSIGKPKLADYDGPAQVRSFNAGTDKGTGFPCSATMSQTWNPSLVYSFGINYGMEMSALGVDGAYAFGCNLHRSPFAGRNYEYLSEDGYLSAVLLTQEVKGLKNMGKYTYLKHLVLGECEHDREAMYTWLTEQSLREIYLKPFQMVIQEGGCVGIMTSYNRIGNVWTGGSQSLITGILRNEWGFNGSIVTDYADHRQYMNQDQALRAGADLSMSAKFEVYKTVNEAAVKSSPRLAAQLRETVHHITYAYLSAQYTNAMYNESDDVEEIFTANSAQSWVWWKPLLTAIDIFVGGGVLFAVWFLIRDKSWFAAKGTVAATVSEENKEGTDNA